MVVGSGSLWLRTPEHTWSSGKTSAFVGMKMFLQVTFRARSLKGGCGLQPERGLVA